jgi:hypothetical protein
MACLTALCLGIARNVVQLIILFGIAPWFYSASSSELYRATYLVRHVVETD